MASSTTSPMPEMSTLAIPRLIFPVDFRSDRNRPVTALDFIPKAEAWQLTETALRECYGYAFYVVTGR